MLCCKRVGLKHYQRRHPIENVRFVRKLQLTINSLFLIENVMTVVIIFIMRAHEDS